MKLTAIFLFIMCLHVSAKTNGQTITLDLKKAPIEKVFTEISRQAGVSFLYNQSLFQGFSPVTIKVKDATVSEVLNECLKDQPFSYSIQDQTIVVKQKITALTTDDSRLINEPPPPIDVHGRIVNEDGDPVAGVSVKVKGTNIGTSTNANGEFTLTGIDANAILIFTGTDIETFERSVKGRTDLGTLSAKTKVISGQEVIVNKGYYTQKQMYNTGDVTRVDGKDIAKQPVTDPLLALEGRVPGLFISQSSGVPGAYSTVQLRGQNSLLNYGGNGITPLLTSIQTQNDPLYIVDGVQFNSESLSAPFGHGTSGSQMLQSGGYGVTNRIGLSPFNLLNPADIESIEVLKDADATAIYGAKGSNGVILITTKKGKSGPLKIDLNVNAGSSKIARKIQMLNTQEYLQMELEGIRNVGGSGDLVPSSAIYYPDLMIWDTTRYTDWQKILLDRPASFYNAQINISGGYDQLRYSVGGSYSQNGTTLPGDFSDKKISVYSKLNSTSLNKRFDLGISAFYTDDNSNLPGANFTNYLTLPPDAPALYDIHGNLNWENYQGGGTFVNPLASTLNRSNTRSVFLNGSGNVRYNILEGLSISCVAGYGRTQSKGQNLAPGASIPPPDNIPNNATGVYTEINLSNWNIEPQLTYHKKIYNGILDVLVGSTFQGTKENNTTYKSLGFLNDALITNPLAASTYSLINYSLSQGSYNSIYGRLGYIWNEKYVANFTARRDGSSRFGPKRKFGNFGSIGIAWIFSKEHFIEKNLPWLSVGKLRASYGSAGSDNVGDYQYLRTYSIVGGTNYQGTQVLAPNGHANPYYQWQVNKKLEFGLDLSFFQDKFGLNASYYRNRTTNQLTNYPTPLFTGAGSVVENLNALIQNTGWEFSAYSLNIRRKDFSWNSSFNISFPKNKLVSFPGLEKTSYASNYTVGYSLSARWVYHYLGVDPETGIYTFATKNGTGQPGNGSPYNSPDKVMSKPITINYQVGGANTITYKDFSLDFLFQFVKQLGWRIQNSLPYPGSLQVNQPTYVLNRWNSPKQLANMQLFTGPYGSLSDMYTSSYSTFMISDGAITDASFIRLKNISLSYQLPESWQKKAHLRNARIYVQCQNLLTITKYQGWDPETQGINLPPMRTITGGIQLGL